MQKQHIKRAAVGLITAVAVLVAFDLLPSPIPTSMIAYQAFGYFYLWPGIEGGIVMALAAFCGAFISNIRFAGIAVSLAVVSWIFVIYFVNAIAASAGQGDVLHVAGTNSLGLILAIIGAAVGASLGYKLSIRARQSQASTA